MSIVCTGMLSKEYLSDLKYLNYNNKLKIKMVKRFRRSRRYRKKSFRKRRYSRKKFGKSKMTKYDGTVYSKVASIVSV